MDDISMTMVRVPVPVDVAEKWSALPVSEQERIGRLVSMVVSADPVEQFEAAMDELHERVRQSGLTEAEVDAELAAWDAERRR